MKENVFFVSGIDTDTGKSYATGYLAKLWNGQGIRTITQKLIQTTDFRKTSNCTAASWARDCCPRIPTD